MYRKMSNGLYRKRAQVKILVSMAMAERQTHKYMHRISFSTPASVRLVVKVNVNYMRTPTRRFSFPQCLSVSRWKRRT